MISELYKQLEALATSEFGDVVEDAEMIPSYTGRVRKLRIKLIDQTFVDVWYTADGEYSFHWEQGMIRNSIYRHDNAPHEKWSYISTFPCHCHDGTQNNVVESHLSLVPATALREFLSIVRKKIIQLKHIAS
jgi:hypothetical protein